MSAGSRHRPVDPRPSFPALEEEVLGRWRQRDVFRESIRRREGADPWVFYEGPPTANGRPGAHHVLSRVFKDLFPRYKTMCGYSVERKGGWDCHGLPVEIEVERQLGIRNKDDVERYGIAEFNQRCRESVFEFLEEWNALTERVRGQDAAILGRFAGGELVGTRYAPPFPYIPASAYGERGHTVLPGDFVSAEDGTGLVHTGIAFGEDDFRLAQQQGLTVVNPVRPDGTFDERMGPFTGRYVREADPDLIDDLRARGRVFRAEEYEHSYPFCWRSDTPLIYYAKRSWYIRTSARRDRLLAANDKVAWHPEHIKHGRFGKWLENNVDWALSRERYWGTPLPIWRCEEGHAECIGSFAELHERSGVALEDPHRPYVDDVTYGCRECGREMQRVI